MFESPARPAQPAQRRKIRSPRAMSAVAALSIAALSLAGCTAPTASQSIVNTALSEETSTFFNAETVHEISVTTAPDDITQALATYAKDGTKEWVTAEVTIDGTTLKNVGLRLKGNSTLRGADTESEAATLPWLLRLDKFIDGQSYSGRTDFVIRTNTSESSLNEAVALELLGEAGLATEHAAATRFTLNDSDAQLRLVIDNPSDELYSEESFDVDGITYKADSSGDYSYRGDQGSDYATAFEVESGTDDLEPIATFLDFVNNSSDEDFAGKLTDYLDTDQFARYLAMQDLVSNSDDIDGPGNNSFLRYDAASKKMTVVAWDQNMSFGSGGMGGGKGGGPGMDADSLLSSLLPEGMKLAEAKELIAAGEVPEGVALPAQIKLDDGTTLIEVLQDLVDGQIPDGLGRGGGQRPQMPEDGGTMPSNMTPPNGDAAPGGAQDQQGTGADSGQVGGPPDGGGRDGGMGGKSNPLVTRYLENETFKAKYEQVKTDLTTSLYDSGTAKKILDKWSELLSTQASDLIDAQTVTSEAEAISKQFTADAADAASPKQQQNSTAPKEDEENSPTPTVSASAAS